jgi:thiol-disulfide isomerase/thioredoxin/cbb3-type cytochrome oxidase subunit 3
MSTKKIVLIVGGIIAVLGLLVALFVGGVVWIAFSAIGKSEAAQTAKAFLQRNEKLKSDIGEVRDFGFWVTGDINASNSYGEALLNLKVIGAKKTVPASVNLTYRSGRAWIVVEASYRNDAGQTVMLVEDSDPPPPVLGAVGTEGAGEYIKEIVGPQFDTKVLAATDPVLVIFGATGSAETQRVLPALDEVAREYSSRVPFYIVYVDINNLGRAWDHSALAERNGVQVTPTVILYRHGKERARIEGARPAAEFSRMIEKQIKK